MNCKEALPLMHEVLDGDATAEQAWKLRMHLAECESCSHIYRSMETTEALMRAMPIVCAPSGMAERIMAGVPAKRGSSWLKWLKRHPAISVAAVFLMLMFGSLFSMWNGDKQLVVKGDLEELVFKGNTVIVPSGHTVDGNLVVQGGKLEVEDNANVRGNITVIDGSLQMASTAHIAGHINQIDAMFDWVWYKLTEFVDSIRY